MSSRSIFHGYIRRRRKTYDDTSDNSEDTIALRFERQVAAVPDKLAIVTDEMSLTYRALDLEASRIAAALASLPSQRDRPIALFMKDEAARIAAMLGALKANRIFIPLASDSPEKWVTKSSKTPEPRRSSSIVLPARLRSLRPPAASLSWRSSSSLDHRSHSWPIGPPLQMIRPISSIRPVRLVGQRAWLAVIAV